MITHCPYCDYAKPDRMLNADILRVMAEPDLPEEDYLLWFERLILVHGFTEYSGVKVHIGRKHKGRLNQPAHTLNDIERELIGNMVMV